jgi:hypothetical protein
MSEFEPDPSASTGRFRAFVERGDEEFTHSRRSSPSPAVLVVAAVVLIAAVIVIIALA